MPATVPAMEEVQKRTEEHEDVRQDTEEMSRVLGHEKEGANGKKGDQYDVAPRS